MVRRRWICLLLVCIAFSTASSCSCVDGSLNRPNDEAITDDFKRSTDVYTAVVTAADCKCFPQSGTTTRLDCLSYVVNDNSVVIESVGERYECSSDDGFNGYAYSACDVVRTTLVSSATVDTIPDLPPINNVTQQENCGVSRYTGEGCQLSNQPCFYNVTVRTVYKGNFVTGEVLVTSGPDFLTSCDDYAGMLTLGVEYVLGIGGACNPISKWSTLDSYSEDEIALLESLQQQCAEDPSTCNGSSGYHFIGIHILLATLVILTTILVN